MTPLDAKMVPKVALLVKRLGTPAILRPPGTYNPSTGRTSDPGAGVEVNIVPPSRYWVGAGRDGVGGLSTDLRCEVPAQGLASAPAPGGTLTYDGRTLQITRVDPVMTGARAAMYTLYLEG